MFENSSWLTGLFIVTGGVNNRLQGGELGCVAVGRCPRGQRRDVNSPSW